MRGSKFQQISVTEALIQDKQYKRHKNQLSSVKGVLSLEDEQLEALKDRFKTRAKIAMKFKQDLTEREN